MGGGGMMALHPLSLRMFNTMTSDIRDREHKILFKRGMWQIKRTSGSAECP